jgi:16S rRNA (cytosine1402-N4)-methyltransferase
MGQAHGQATADDIPAVSPAGADEEVVELFQPVPDGIVVDATFGGGGHTRALSKSLGERVTMIGVDRDPDARANAGDVTVLAGSFGDLDRLLDDAGDRSISGALFDLGISSHQVDDPSRGFSYREDGPLDMRMDPDQGSYRRRPREHGLGTGPRPHSPHLRRGALRLEHRPRDRPHRPFTRTLELSEVIAGRRSGRRAARRSPRPPGVPGVPHRSER